MIILPERGLVRTRLLMPIKDAEWRQPSQRTSLFAIENQTRFCLMARLNDGYVVWKGWFDDYADADAFLLALFTGTLHLERALWDLPSPSWDPDIGGGQVSYDFANVTFLTTTSGSYQTWPVPSYWAASNNTVEALGGGASGSAAGGTNYGGGGGGAAYAKTNNVPLTPSGSGYFFIAATAAAVSTSGSGVAGNSPANTWLSTITSAPGNTSQGVLAKSGQTTTPGLPPSGGSGGLSGSCIGNTAYSGGSTTNEIAGGAGGGAAGPSGAGGSPASAPSSAQNGGSSNNGTLTGGAGAIGTTASNGQNGTEWQSSPARGSGSGGGGAGNGTNANNVGGTGGSFGGGGGGGAGGGNNNSTSGAGFQGLLVASSFSVINSKLVSFSQSQSELIRRSASTRKSLSSPSSFTAVKSTGWTPGFVMPEVLSSIKGAGKPIRISDAELFSLSRAPQKVVVPSVGQSLTRSSGLSVAKLWTMPVVVTPIQLMSKGFFFLQSSTLKSFSLITKGFSFVQGMTMSFGAARPSGAVSISLLSSNTLSFIRSRIEAFGINTYQTILIYRNMGTTVVFQPIGSLVTLVKQIAESSSWMMSSTVSIVKNLRTGWLIQSPLSLTLSGIVGRGISFVSPIAVFVRRNLTKGLVTAIGQMFTSARIMSIIRSLSIGQSASVTHNLFRGIAFAQAFQVSIINRVSPSLRALISSIVTTQRQTGHATSLVIGHSTIMLVRTTLALRFVVSQAVTSLRSQIVHIITTLSAASLTVSHNILSTIRATSPTIVRLLRTTSHGTSIASPSAARITAAAGRLLAFTEVSMLTAQANLGHIVVMMSHQLVTLPRNLSKLIRTATRSLLHLLINPVIRKLNPDLFAFGLFRHRIVTGEDNAMSATNILEPPIEPVVEFENIAFDYGLVLADGVKILSAVLTCSVYSGTDATPASRLISYPVVAPSPRTGKGSQAVVQEVGTMVDGVVYRIQCAATTDDGQVKVLTTYLQSEAA